MNDRLSPGQYHRESKEELERRTANPYGTTFGTSTRQACAPGKVPVGQMETTGTDWAHLGPGLYTIGELELPEGGRMHI